MANPGQAELKRADFQEAAVRLICDRLLDPKGSRRFLLADEVGLGKTIVARGVVEELLRRKGELDVVYLCSNAEIAEQNRKRLDPEASRVLRRVTELAYGGRPRGALRVFSFTPGTSLSAGTGLAWERRLLLFLVWRVLRQDIRKAKWREFFRCGVAPGTWTSETRFSVLVREFRRRLSTDFQRLVSAEWRRSLDVEGRRVVLAEALIEAVTTFDATQADSRRRRNVLVAALRVGLQRVALDDLSPDLVILDEVQRFRHVIHEADSADAIAARLFRKKSTAVLILSATPYKMLSLDHETADHYSDFLATVRFLFSTRGDEEVADLRKDLEAFRQRLEAASFVEATDEELLKVRASVEKRLRRVISRTERNWYIEDHEKGVEEVKPSGAAFAVPRTEELSDYVRLRRYLLDKAESSQHITEYWKSCPAPFTFMDAQYAAMASARKCRKAMPAGLVEPVRSLTKLSARSLRFRMLDELVFGPGTERWKYLWTRPSYTYYEDAFFHEADPRKVLVFSGWRFVPKAIALLASHGVEQRIRPGGRIWSADDQAPLRFNDKGSFHVFDVCCPSPALAALVDPAALAHERLSARDVLRRAEKALGQALAQAGVEVGETNRSPIWAVVARLESVRSGDGTLLAALQRSRAFAGEATDRFREHVIDFVVMADNKEPLRISRDRLRHLAEIAAFSPGSSLLRAFWSMYPETHGAVPDGLVDLCFRDVRAFFNKRPARAIIEDAAPKAGYARAVLHYCSLAHFQAVADEYLFLVKEVLQRSNALAAAEHLGRVFGIGTGTPTVNTTVRLGNGEERLRRDPVPRRSHFALAFGDDVRGEQGAPTPEQSFESRKTAVREAFNSPFWPFVLATTSVGQEGLDFHLYCRDIVHWNLPSNPVDLEQREGRINRRDGSALRRSIAKDWPLDKIERLAKSGTNFWQRVFDAIGRSPGLQQYKHGMYPHWVYERESGSSERIRRHLFFYENSQDARRYEELKERLALYRLVFGQPRQQDLLDSIQQRLAAGQERDQVHQLLTRYMVNLSPVREQEVHARARREASELIKSPSSLEQLIAAVERLESERGPELAAVASQLQLLKNVVRDHVAGQADDGPHELQEAVFALSYLRNPFDTVFDSHRDHGLQDDCRIIDGAATKIRAASGRAR